MARDTGIPDYLESVPPARRRRTRPLDLNTDIVAADVKPLPAKGAKDPKLSKSDQAGFAYLVRGLEVLNAIASCETLPVAMRQRAAEVMVEQGSAMSRGPRSIGKPLPPPAPMPSHFAPDAAAPVGEQAAPDEQIPDGWGEEAPGGSETPLPPPTLEPLPPPPPDLNLAGDATVRNRCEQRVIKILEQRRSAKVATLKVAVLGDRWKPVMDIEDLLKDMLAKGTIAKHNENGGPATFYYLTRRPPLPLPPMRVRS